jgi:integrator complex subunit 8
MLLSFLQIKVIGLLELNANNNEEIQREAASIWMVRFLRAVARLCTLNSKYDEEVQREAANICSSCFLRALAIQHVS